MLIFLSKWLLITVKEARDGESSFILPLRHCSADYIFSQEGKCLYLQTLTRHVFTQGCAAEWMSDYTTRNTSFCLSSYSEGNYSTYHQELLSFVLCACSGTLSDVQVY